MHWLQRFHNTFWIMWAYGVTTIKTDVPSPPVNLTLAEILPDAAVVTWDADVSDEITLFEMTVRPLSYSPRVVKAHLDGSSRSYLISPLYPATEYELYIAALNMDGISNVSDVITFRTQQADSATFRPDIHPGEVIIVCLILMAWFCAIAMFLHKWGTLRILQAPEPRYNHSPKNIETIKVVKRPTDSIIYKSYSSQISKTMVARQKRIERMNTMPNIKVNIKELNRSPRAAPIKEEEAEKREEEAGGGESDGKRSGPDRPDKYKYKVFSRMVTSPVLEIDERAHQTSST